MPFGVFENRPTKNTYCQLYNSLVEPVQDYVLNNWGFENTEMCNKVLENLFTHLLALYVLDCCQISTLFKYF